MSTLHDQLEAAIKERLAVAQAAQPGPWMTGEIAPHLVDSVVYGQSTSWPNRITQACNVEYADGGMANARHIAANGPDRIIRDCTEDLWLLKKHPPCTDEDCAGGDCHRCAQFMPCSHIVSLARRYGISLSTKEGTT